jgi:hypothetical protein
MTDARYDELREVIREVRRRWRLKVALRGAAIVVAAGLLALGVSAYAMDHFRYEPWAVTSFRVFAYVALLALTARFLVLPLWGRISDERVALYLEENEPSLEAAVLSAVEVGGPSRAPERADRSEVLAARLVESAIEKCRTIDYGRPVERPGLRRASALLAAAAALGMALVIVSPAFLRHAAPFLIAPWSVRAASPYAIEVDPGNSTVPRGASPAIVARLTGFEAETVELVARSGSTTDWKRWPMVADAASRGFRVVLFSLDGATDYFVEANDVRSPVFHIDVAELPYVKRIDLEYRFPAYTGLSAETHEDVGDVVAVRGTEVRVKVTPTIAVASGRLHVDGAPPQPLSVAGDGTLAGSFEVAQEGFYRIELPRPDGSVQAASPDYTIDVIADQPPSVTLLKPGRDAKVTAIEEVFTELRAEDDFGVARTELVYSVNGGPEKTLVLQQGRARKTLSAAHTFFLEELTLEPGDFVSYFARATDGSTPAQSTTTDIYFMEVRPFEREYRQADQKGGGGGAGGDSDAALSFQQRQIIAATFKLVRDKARADPKQHGDDLGTLAEVQERLRGQVESLVRRIGNRGTLGAGSDMEKTAEALRSAAEEMTAARDRLGARKAKEALSPEQAALMHLQRAEAVFRDVQVSFDQRGSGNGSALNAEDLADLFELELDKLKNQYETVERGNAERRAGRVDEALERLRELARRQEQEIERRRRFAGRLPNQAGGGGGSARDLARDTEELARQLERLARESPSPAMQEAARRLQDAVNAMKRSAQAGQGGSVGESEAALQRLRDARRGVEADRSARVERGVQDAARRAEGLARAQQEMASEAEDAVARREELAGPAPDRAERLLERKDGLVGEVSDLEGQLDRLAREARAEKKGAARKLQEAGAVIRDSRLGEKIRYSKGVVKRGTAEQSRELEAEIGSDLSSLGRKLQEAAAAAGPSAEDRRAAALERMRDLARSLESLGERLDEHEAPERSAGQGADTQRSAADGPSRVGSRGGAAAGGPVPGSPRLAPGAPGSGLGVDGEEARQLGRELRERLREADALSRELGGKAGGGDLQEAIRALRRLEDQKTYEPRALGRLIASVVEGLKSTEFALRRDLEGPDREKLFLSGGQDLPPGWQSLVQEYYRSLARKPEGR